MYQTPELPAALPARPKAKSRSHSQWLTLISQWQSSGLSERAFCDSQGVRLDTFRKHRYQANKVSGKKTRARSGFKTVKVVKAIQADFQGLSYCIQATVAGNCHGIWR